jgi:6-phosphogluconate dehydrogenase
MIVETASQRGVLLMEVGIVGLGKMGYPLALNMHEKGYKVIVLSRSAEKAATASSDGLEGTSDPVSFAGAFSGRRIVWLMVPAGKAVDDMINHFVPLLSSDDIIVDGGNSHYRDSLRRAEMLKPYGIDYVDIGISGGPSGAREGACMMVGAAEETYAYLEPLLKDICVNNGCLRAGRNGSGHYVKMVHNGIEYGMMQAIAEGFELMDSGPFGLDYKALAELWNNGSVIRSWLIELTAQMFAADPGLTGIKGVAGSSGTGLWTVEEALAEQVPLPVITQALFARYRSQQENSFSARVVAGLRREFGGHAVIDSENEEGS